MSYQNENGCNGRSDGVSSHFLVSSFSAASSAAFATAVPSAVPAGLLRLCDILPRPRSSSSSSWTALCDECAVDVGAGANVGVCAGVYESIRETKLPLLAFPFGWKAVAVGVVPVSISTASPPAFPLAELHHPLM